MNISLNLENQNLWKKGLLLSLPVAASVLVYIKRSSFEAIAFGAMAGLIGISYLRNKDLKPLDNETILRPKLTIHMAAKLNSIEGASQLLEQGAKVDSKNKYKQTPLHIAARYGNEVMIEFLLAKNANPNEIDHKGNTPFHNAAQRGYEKSTEILCNSIEDPLVQNNDGFNAFHLATQSGRLRVMELLVNRDIDPNVPNGQGLTALHIAVIHGKIDAIKKLHSFKVDMDPKNPTGITPLHMAALYMKKGKGKIDTVLQLLKNGANWRLKDDVQNTFFSYIGSVTKVDGTAIEEAINGQNPGTKIAFRYQDDLQNPDRKYFSPIGL